MQNFIWDVGTTRDQILTQILSCIIMVAVWACLNHAIYSPETKKAVPIWAQICCINTNSVALVICNCWLDQEHIFSVLQ